jgi:hypothetical protein
VGALDAEVVEDSERVRDEVVTGVARLARRIGSRAARVAVVVADDVPTGGGQSLAKGPLPPVHRPTRAHDQQYGRASGVADGVDAQRGAVDLCSHIRSDCRRLENSSIAARR